MEDLRFDSEGDYNCGVGFLGHHLHASIYAGYSTSLTGTEERATVIIVSGYDYSKENEAVLPPLVRVQNIEDETEFRVYLFHGEIDAGEYIQIEYLPHSKHARVIQKDG